MKKKSEQKALRFSNQHRLIWQIVPPLLICIAITTLFSGVSVYHSTMKQLTAEKETDARRLAYTAKSDLEHTANIEWLMEYWQDNYESMDIIWDDDDAVNVKKDEFISLNPGIDPCGPTETELAELDEYSRKLYAEISYMILINKFDEYKNIYSPQFLFCFRVLHEDGDPSYRRFYLLTAKTEGETRGTNEEDIYMLGHVDDIDCSTHPILLKTWETGEEQTGFEQTNSLDRYRIHVYVPVKSESGSLLCIISVSIDAHTMRNSLAKNLNIIEFINVIIFLLSVSTLIFIMEGIIVKPITNMSRSVQKFETDMDSDRLCRSMEIIKNRNEIGALANTVSNMGASLSYYIDTTAKISAKEERINTELSLATIIQTSSLPRNFDTVTEKWPGLQISASMKPAREVGGDFYNFQILDDDHLAIIIADVSGKGVPAALFMMVSSILISENSRYNLHPGKILERVNSRICDHNEADMFVTVWLGILEVSTGHLIAANAGHEYPILKKGTADCELYKDKHSFVIGGLKSTKYKEYELDLHSGDILYLYTDGIAEASDAADAQYGTDRLLTAINESDTSSPEALISAITENVNGFVNGAEQFDDMTQVCLFYSKDI